MLGIWASWFNDLVQPRNEKATCGVIVSCFLRYVFCVAAILFSQGVDSDVKATPILFNANGHYYDAVAVPSGVSFTWDDARAAVDALPLFMGLKGHLVTITSSAEQDFLNASFPGTYFYALGGFQPSGSPEPGGGWEWVTGEPFLFLNWGPIEPNNAGGRENSLRTANFDRPPFGSWNDANSDSGIAGYFIEYEAQNSTSVSEPSSLSTIAIGLFFIAMFYWIRSRGYRSTASI